MMDKELAPEIANRSRNRSLLIGVVVVVVLAIAITWLRDAVKTSVEAEKFARQPPKSALSKIR